MPNVAKLAQCCMSLVSPLSYHILYQQLLCDILHFIMLVNISIFLPCDLYLPQSWYFMDMVVVSNFEACEIVFIWAELRCLLLRSIPRGKAHITNFPDCITFYYNWAVHIPKQGLTQPASSADSLETETLLVHCEGRVWLWSFQLNRIFAAAGPLW